MELAAQLTRGKSGPTCAGTKRTKCNIEAQSVWLHRRHRPSLSSICAAAIIIITIIIIIGHPSRILGCTAAGSPEDKNAQIKSEKQTALAALWQVFGFIPRNDHPNQTACGNSIRLGCARAGCCVVHHHRLIASGSCERECRSQVQIGSTSASKIFIFISARAATTTARQQQHEIREHLNASFYKRSIAGPVPSRRN
uniref:Uncharacterized protein n=1 Tax=Anopheles merus TaxID=30066 RepID=A0A182V476_ANOME